MGSDWAIQGEQPTTDDLVHQEIADAPLTASVLASCLTYAQRDVGADAGNDAVAEALTQRLMSEGWKLARTVPAASERKSV
jgi:hypothetical protein